MTLFPITRQNRWGYYALTYTYVISLYLFSNHHQIFPIHYLSLTPIDANCPYLPWTGWIYILVFFIPLVCCVIVEDEGDMARLVCSFAGVATLCTTIFVLFPTLYPRPTEELAATLVNWPLRFVHSQDTPANSLPSQHVAAAFLSAFFIHRYRKSWGNIAIVLGVLISISTLTTKQHYVWDVVLGYSIARFSYLIVTSRLWSRLSRSDSRSEVVQ